MAGAAGFPVDGDWEARRAWFAAKLEGRSRADCILLAARAALRMLPLLGLVLPEKSRGATEAERLSSIVLPLFRCNALSLAASLAPASERDQRDRFRAAASAAFSAARSARSTAASAALSVAAAYSARSTSRSTDAAASAALSAAAAALSAADAASAAYFDAAASRSSAAAAFSADAAFSAAAALSAAAPAASAAASAADAFVADLEALGAEGTTDEMRGVLAVRPLWPENPPRRIEAEWLRLDRRLCDAEEEDWDVWAEWYPAVLSGASGGRYIFGLPTARALKLWHDVALIDDAIWKAGPKTLNAEFKRLVAEARGEGEPVASEEAGDNPDIPPQQAGPRFGETEARLDLIETAPPEDGPPTKRGQTLLDEMRDAAVDLVASMNKFGELPNDHPRLRKLIDRYKDLISLDNPDPDVVFAMGLRLEEALRAAKRQITTRDEPELEDEPSAALESLIRLNAIFVATTQSGRELLDAAERYAYSRSGDGTFQQAARPVVEKLDAGGMTTEKALEILQAAVEAVNTGSHPHRQGLVARTGVSNALSYLGNAAVQGTIGNTTFEAAKVVAASAAFSSAVAEGASIATKSAAFFLQYAPELTALAQSSSEALRWVPHLIEWLKIRLRL